MSENQAEQEPWHARDPDEAIAAQDVDPQQGLSQHEAERRLQEYGRNVLVSSEGTSPWRMLARQFADVLIAILAVAAIVSAAIGEWVDALAILAILVLNGVLGFVQEWRAERAIGALRQMLAPEATVRRDGHDDRRPAERVVPGDIVCLGTGDRVPADLRLIESTELRLDESALTGEAAPVAKGVEPVEADTTLDARSSMAWMGTVVTNGRGLGVVVATGHDSEFGRIAEMTRAVGEDRTPLQQSLASLGRQLGAIALAVSALVAVAGIATGKPPLEMLLTGVALAVAVVPEGLPAIVTITLAVGIRAMVRRNALLRRLSAAETLGSASVICTDKTGTLTENEMTLRRICLPAGSIVVTGTGYEPEGHFERARNGSGDDAQAGTEDVEDTEGGEAIELDERPDLRALLEIGLHCSHARLEQSEDGSWTAVGDPTEAALVVAARKAGLESSEEEPEHEVPFDSDRKRMSMVRVLDGERYSLVKGAPEVLLERATRILDGDEERELGDEDREQIEQATEKLAEDGLRTLALARRSASEGLEDEELESELTWVGLVGILDPPRPEVADAIEEAKAAGIGVIVVTGDAAKTATAIAQSVGLDPQRVLLGSDLEEMDEDELREALRDSQVLFARTAPAQKLRIVEILQSLGHVVAMTGDGVNDAPALKKADIGVAMGVRGTDVARGASDMVLADDNFASIVSAVKEGRRQYDNIRKFVGSLLSSNAGELVAILLHTLMGGALILLPVQILWMNLVTDGLLAIALGLEPAERGIMHRPPRSRDERILPWTFGAVLAGIGLYVGLVVLWLFVDARADGRSLEEARSLAFCGLIMLEIVNALNFRGLRAPLPVIGPFSNPWLLAAVAGTVALQVGVVYWPPAARVLHVAPLALSDWGLLLAFSVPLLLVPEAIKVVLWRRDARSASAREANRS